MSGTVLDVRDSAFMDTQDQVSLLSEWSWFKEQWSVEVL